jgi:hypothetical protein
MDFHNLNYSCYHYYHYYCMCACSQLMEVIILYESSCAYNLLEQATTLALLSLS